MMRKLNRYCAILFAVLLLLSGCNKSTGTTTSKSSNSSSKSSSSSAKAQTAQVSSGTSVSINTSSFSPMAPITPVKSSAIVLSGSTIYYSNWSDGDKLYKISTNGTGKQKLTDDAVSEFILNGSLIYYSNKSDYFKLYSLNLDGTGKQKLLDEKASNLTLMENYLYFIDSASSIAAVDIDSKAKIQLNAPTRYFDTDGTQIFYENFEGDQLSMKSINIDGTNNVKIIDDEPLGIVSSQGTLFYINSLDGGKIYKVSPDGSNKMKLNDFSSSNIQIDNGWIYYINHSDFQKLYKMKLDGTSSTKLSDEDFVKAYTIAGTFIYFDRNTDINHPIYKINK